MGDGTQTYTYDTNTTNGYSDGMLTGTRVIGGVTYQFASSGAWIP